MTSSRSDAWLVRTQRRNSRQRSPWAFAMRGLCSKAGARRLAIHGPAMRLRGAYDRCTHICVLFAVKLDGRGGICFLYLQTSSAEQCRRPMPARARGDGSYSQASSAPCGLESRTSSARTGRSRRCWPGEQTGSGDEGWNEEWLRAASCAPCRRWAGLDEGLLLHRFESRPCQTCRIRCAQEIW